LHKEYFLRRIILAKKKVTIPLPPKNKVKELVSLFWQNSSVSDSVPLNGVPKGVSVNFAKGTWTADGQTHLIGKSIPFSGSEKPKDGIVGIYNRREVSHLEQMMKDSRDLHCRFGPCKLN
jgi:hypothetical protein